MKKISGILLLLKLLSERLCELTLIRQEVQHGLQQEGQVAYRQGRVAHATGGIHQFMQQTHLNGGPASVGT